MDYRAKAIRALILALVISLIADGPLWAMTTCCSTADGECRCAKESCCCRLSQNAVSTGCCSSGRTEKQPCCLMKTANTQTKLEPSCCSKRKIAAGPIVSATANPTIALSEPACRCDFQEIPVLPASERETKRDLRPTNLCVDIQQYVFGDCRTVRSELLATSEREVSPSRRQAMLCVWQI